MQHGSLVTTFGGLNPSVSHPCYKLERELLALPVRLAGMGILNPMTCSSQCFNSSKRLISPLVALIISQEEKLPSIDATLSETRIFIQIIENVLVDCIHVYDNLSAKQQRLVDLSREKGASSWFSVLHLDECGFSLHKGEF